MLAMETDSRLKILTCSSLHVIILTIQNASVIILCVLLKIHIKIHKENNSVQHAYLIAWDLCTQCLDILQDGCPSFYSPVF